MATIKKRQLILNSGRRIKLTGIGVFISPELEIGEGFTNNIYCPPFSKSDQSVGNPYKLSVQELHEIADCIIKSAVEFKEQLSAINTPRAPADGEPPGRIAG